MPRAAMPRRAIPLSERDKKGTPTEKDVITAGTLAGGGKLYPKIDGLLDDVRRAIADKKSKNKVKKEEVASALAAAPKTVVEDCTPVAKIADAGAITRLYIPVLKANAEEKSVTGVVLEPEVVDAQGDIYDAKVIADAAHDFMSVYNESTQLGLMHKDMKRDFDLWESWVAPTDVTIGDKEVRAGSWVMTVRVNDDEIWQKVKDGKIRGFSIGGKATVKKLAA